MTLLYLDASAIVPLLYPEDDTDLMFALVRREELAASELAIGEACAGLARRVRERELAPHEFERLMLELDSYRRLWGRPTIVNEDLYAATMLVRRLELGLRMPDATHLACCVRLGMTMLSFDARLQRAAHALGIPAYLTTA